MFYRTYKPGSKTLYTHLAISSDVSISSHISSEENDIGVHLVQIRLMCRWLCRMVCALPGKISNIRTSILTVKVEFCLLRTDIFCRQKSKIKHDLYFCCISSKCIVKIAYNCSYSFGQYMTNLRNYYSIPFSFSEIYLFAISFNYK